MRTFLLATILFLFVGTTLLVAHDAADFAPALNVADDDTDGITTNDVRIDIEESLVTVYGAEGMHLEVVSLTGLSVYKVRIESKSQSIQLKIPKGCYIVKVGTVVRKIAIR